MLRILSRVFRSSQAHAIDPKTLILSEDSAIGSSEGQGRRFIDIPGAVNLRDLGGYSTQDGRTVKWGQIYRSGSLAHLSNDDVTTFSRLGIKLVCDLRSREEIETAPEVLQGVQTDYFPIQAEVTLFERVRAIFMERRRLADLLLRAYTELMITQNAHIYGEVFRRLADNNNLPVLIRCTAGKDRTGITVALLLLALGVPEETVIADYSLSNHYYEEFKAYAQQAIGPLGFVGIRAEDLQPLLLADPDMLRQTLTYVQQQYGSVRKYLLDYAGVDEDTIYKLKENLLN